MDSTAASSNVAEERLGVLERWIDLEAWLRELARAWWLLSLVALFCGALAWCGSRIVPVWFESSVLVAPAANNESSMISRLGSQVGGLAALAGFEIGASDGGVDRTSLALAILESRAFLTDFIARHGLMDELFPEPGVEEPPSLDDAYGEFLELLDIDLTHDAGLIELSIEHNEPEKTKLWLELLVSDLNEHMRRKDRESTERMLAHLTTELEKTQVRELRDALFQLVEQQARRRMMSEARLEYVLETVDPAFLPERPAGPNRLLLGLIGALLGGLLFALGVAVRASR